MGSRGWNVLYCRRAVAIPQIVRRVGSTRADVGVALLQFEQVVLLNGFEWPYDPCDYVAARHANQGLRCPRPRVCQTTRSDREPSIDVTDGDRVLSRRRSIRLPMVEAHHEILGRSDLTLEMSSTATC